MYIKRNELVEKVVVGSDGNTIGKVSDIVVSLPGKIGLVVKTKEGEDIIIEASDVQAVGEYVLCRLTGPQAREKHLRGSAPPAPPAPGAAPLPPPTTPYAPPTGPVCPSCGHVNPPGARFCERCGTKLV